MNSTTLNRLLACTALVGISGLSQQAMAAEQTLGTTATTTALTADNSAKFIAPLVAGDLTAIFTVDDNVNVGEGGVVVSATTLDNVGTLKFLGTSTATGTIGGAANRLGLLEFNGTAEAVAITGNIFATNVSFTGTTTATLSGDTTTTAINFGADGVLVLNDGADVTGAITNTVDNTGTLTLNGTNTVTGAIGSTGAGLFLISAGADTKIVTLSGDVKATTLAFTGAGTVALGGNFTGAISFADKAGTLTTAALKTITGNITGTADIQTVINAATIVGNTDLGAGANVFTNTGKVTGSLTFGADGDTVTNTAGTITGATLLGDGANFFTQTGAATVTGNITGGADVDTLSLGVGGTVTGNIDLLAGNNVFGNAGKVTGNLLLGAGDDTVTNTAGTITGATTLGDGVNSFTQTGAATVTGNITGGTGVDTLSLGVGGTVTGNIDLLAGANVFGNAGKVIGNLAFGADGDTVTNTAGTITGNTTLGDGANFFTQTAGTTTGSITGGAGVDTLALAGTVTGNFIGGGGDDVFGNAAGTFTGSINSAGGNVAVTNGAAGTLNVNGASDLGAGILSNATPTGTVRLTSTLVTTGALTNGGTVSLGQAAVLTVASQAAAIGTYSFDIHNVGVTGKLVSGAAIDFANDVVNANVLGGAFLADGATFAIADGVGAGLLPAAAVTDNSAIYSFVAVQDADTSNLSLKVTNNLSSIGTSANSIAVGNALEAIGVTTNANIIAIRNTMSASASPAAAALILDSLVPDVGGGAVMVAQMFSSRTMGVVASELASLRLDGDAVSGISAGDNGQGARLWLQAMAGSGEQDPRDGVNGYEAESYGFAAGIDTRSFGPNSVIGAAFSFLNADIDADNVGRGNTEVDAYQGTLYGSAGFGGMNYISGMLGYVWGDNDTNRTVLGGTVNGNYDSDQFVANMEVGHDVKQGIMTFTPNVFANYGNYSADDYTETGVGALNIASEDMDLFELGIGADVMWDIKQSGSGVLRPSLTASYRYDFIADEMNSTASFIGVPGVTFKAIGAEPEENKFNLGAGLKYFDDQWELSAAYGFDYMEDYDGHSGMIRAGFNF